MPKKLSYEFVREYFAKYGYTLLSTVYKNNTTKLKVRCNQGHQYNVTFANFKNHNSRCPRCVGNNPLSYNEVRQYVEEQGYVLVSQKYRSVHVKLDIKCPKGHQYKVTFANFRSGNRCPYCARKRVSYQIVQEYIERHNGKVISKQYKGHQDLLEVECSKGHRRWVTWRNLNQCQGLGCRQCQADTNTLSFCDVKRKIEQEGYTLRSKEYCNAHTKMKVECPRKHIYNVSWNKFQGGHRCPYCLHKSEHKLGQILEELFPNKIKKQGNLGFLGRQRVDYYIEQEKIAIEYDGIQHHEPIIGAFGAKTEEEAQEQLRETQERDKRKEQLCKENGWRLIRIKYDEPLTVENVRRRVRIQEIIGCFMNRGMRA